MALVELETCGCPASADVSDRTVLSIGAAVAAEAGRSPEVSFLPAGYCVCRGNSFTGVSAGAGNGVEVKEVGKAWL